MSSVSYRGGGNQGFPSPRSSFPSPPPKNFEIDKVNSQCNEIQIRYELLWLFMDQASSLVLPWESFFYDGGPGRGFSRLVKADYHYMCINGT